MAKTWLTHTWLFKLLIVGDSGVGKTALLSRFSDDAFSTSFMPTIGVDFKVKTIELENQNIKLQIWDTTGQERFHSIIPAYYRGAMGIMIVYDITDKSTFNNIPKWLSDINEHANEDVEKMLLGNKCDIEENRSVPMDDGVVVAEQHGMLFLETSAKTNINVDQAYTDLATVILHKMQRQSRKESQAFGLSQRRAAGSKGCC